MGHGNPLKSNSNSSSLDPFDLLNPSDLKNTIIKLLESTGFKEGEKLTPEEELAENGDIDAQMQKAKEAEKEHFPTKALHFYILAAHQGNGEAQAMAAKALFSIESDTLALVYLKLGAENESYPDWQRKCQRALAECLEIGKGIPPSSKKAVHYYELAAASLNIEACKRLGQAYLKGELDLQPSLEMAKKYFSIAATEGDLQSIQQLEKLSIGHENILKFYLKSYLKGIDEALFCAGLYLYKLGQVEIAVRYFIRGAQEKCPHAIQALAFCLENGIGIRKSVAEAKYYQNKLNQVHEGDLAALSGAKINLEAQSLPSLSQAILKANQEEISDLKFEAEEENNVNAAWRLGCLYLEGRKVPHSFEMAQKYYSIGADLGGPNSQFLIGYFYDLGIVELSIPKAIFYYEMAANQMYRYAIEALRRIYARRNDLRILKEPDWEPYRAGLQMMNIIHEKISESKDYEWKNRRRIAKNSQSLSLYIDEANKGNPYALWEVADLLFKAGRNEEAIKCLRFGAKSTDPFIQAECELQLGWRFRDGAGIQQSDEKAIYYLTRAAKNNHPVAFRFLSEGYYFGKMGIKISHDLALKYAEMGEKWNDPGCIHLLGLFHANGHCSFAKSEEQAEQYFKRAIDLHYVPAYKSYILLLFSKGGEGNVEKAIQLLSEISEITGWGAFQMGWCYERGIGVIQSDGEAFRHYFISAQAKDQEGKKALARCYREGIGIGRSEDKAKE